MRGRGQGEGEVHGEPPCVFSECFGTMDRSAGTPLVWSPAFRRSGPAKAGTPNRRYMESLEPAGAMGTAIQSEKPLCNRNVPPGVFLNTKTPNPSKKHNITIMKNILTLASILLAIGWSAQAADTSVKLSHVHLAATVASRAWTRRCPASPARRGNPTRTPAR